ncbi:ATP-binding cassette domain-containing protein [Gudongella sp. DL1XJH-153]|uniref:ATP-binding cassette domain-containing protein n=1 Tax=Gudongella sp. DL1XJH-153 TaxID=3409804 RepID=UPI003BB7F84D
MSKMTIGEILQKYPFAMSYFVENKLDVEGYEGETFQDFLGGFNQEQVEDLAMDKKELQENLEIFINQMNEFLGIKEDVGVKSLTILPGYDKSGEAEGFNELTINTSQIISIVGPTGAGKSRLLADIEWTAQKDTPTGRSILINGEFPDKKWRFSSNNKLVAQLSQNMNFVMDLTVMEFLQLHAESRLVEDVEGTIEKIIKAANSLAGEKFQLDTPVTALSGGQSRALMIADTAILSSSPIVLIDEIENAGIDRRKALNLLIDEDKIVLMATHDPTLALIADKRIVIKNGGISKIIETTEEEKEILHELEKIDSFVQAMRTSLRNGESLSR